MLRSMRRPSPERVLRGSLIGASLCALACVILLVLGLPMPALAALFLAGWFVTDAARARVWVQAASQEAAAGDAEVTPGQSAKD